MRAVAVMLSAVLFAGCVTSGPAKAADQNAPDADSFNHYIHAIMLQKEGKYEESLDALEQALDAAPESLPLTLRLVWGYYRLEDYENALAMADRAQELAPNEPGIWTLKGRIYEKIDRYDEAADAFRKAIEMSPGDVLQYEAVIDAEEQSNDLVGVLDVYKRLLELDPDNAQLHFRLGMTLVRINDLDDAREHLQRALELAPDLTRAHYVLGLVNFDLEDFEAAAARFQRVNDNRLDYPNANKFLAGALARQGKLEEAKATLKQAIESGEADPSEHIAYMYLAIRAGETDAAEGAAPPEDAPIVGTLFRALARQAAGEPALPLIETLDQVEGDADMEGQAYLNDLVFVFGEDDVKENLIPSLVTLRQEAAPSRTLDILTARLYMSTDMLLEAEDVLLSMLNRGESTFTVHSYLSIVYEQLDRFEDAETHLKKCLEIRPDDHNTMNTLGYLYAEENVKLDEAEALLNKALEMDPDNAYYLDSLGWIYYRQGQAEKAIELIRRAIYNMESDDPILREHLGDAYLLAGDTARAIEEWEHALRLDPELEGVREKLEQHR